MVLILGCCQSFVAEAASWFIIRLVDCWVLSEVPEADIPVCVHRPWGVALQC